MEYINPPSYANLKKRKRSSASEDGNGGLPYLPTPANPLGYRPNILKQLAVAGLSVDKVLPSSASPSFPHQALREEQQQQQQQDGNAAIGESGEDEGDVGGRGGEGGGGDDPGADERTDNSAASRSCAVLAALVERCLSSGDVPRARRAFALLVRAETRTRRVVDLRQNQYWALGAEILMREGESGPAQGHGRNSWERNAEEGDEAQVPQQGPVQDRWGSAANLPRVRAYYEALIQQFPYSRQWPRATSALTFWPILVGVEMYNIHTEHRLAVRRLEAGAWGDDDGSYSTDGYGEDLMMVDDRGVGPGGLDPMDRASGSRREARLGREKETMRLDALAGMRDVARRMDAVMETAPYSTSHEMLRLRGLVALYMGDLAMPRPCRRRRATAPDRKISTRANGRGPGSARERGPSSARFLRAAAHWRITWCALPTGAGEEETTTTTTAAAMAAIAMAAARTAGSSMRSCPYCP